MNKSNCRQKRSIGKDSPLSKRPKLDFTLKSRISPQRNKDNGKDEIYGCNELIRETNTAPNSDEKKIDENLPVTSDWDDDFSGDMLEKVCLIADLSQAMVKNQSTPETLPEDKTELNVFEENKNPISSDLGSSENGKVDEDLEKLKFEYEKLKEKLKTKEGEVHILRSQLKQSEDAKQAVALQNINVIEDLQKKFNEKVYSTEKELETTKTKLLFKDMEYKTLSERCRQLEYNISKNKLGETKSSLWESTKALSNINTNYLSSQKEKIENENNPDTTSKNFVQDVKHLEFLIQMHHEGKCLAKIVCPELFKFLEEPSMVPLYTFGNEISSHKSRLDFDKREKYKWSNFPKQTIFIKDLYSSVTSLFVHESFSQGEIKKEIENLFIYCEKILIYYKEVFLFLEKLQLHSSENDDPDQSLLENEEEYNTLSIKNLLNGVKINEEECGVEGRRCLGLMCSLVKTSQVAVDIIKGNVGFISLLKDLAAKIGSLRRPLRYIGFLIGISFILQRILLEKDLDRAILSLINETVEEIIFARPKLNVLNEVINILAAGKYHPEFLVALCRKASVESCALYMDSKLKQAMFFTRNACPLKILCMQIMGLACLPSSRSILWDLTNNTIKWLNNSMIVPNTENIKWLPVNSQDSCFDVTECLLYLLSLCLKDFNTNFLYQDNEDGEAVASSIEKTNMNKKKQMISIIGHGSVLLKRILKADQRHLNGNIHCLRFALLLKNMMPSKAENSYKNHVSYINSVQMEAISWIIDLLESDLRNQDCFVKQSTSALSDLEVFNTLKINDNKMY